MIGSLEPNPAIKLNRTDTTLDLSQKAWEDKEQKRKRKISKIVASVSINTSVKDALAFFSALCFLLFLQISKVRRNFPSCR